MKKLIFLYIQAALFLSVMVSCKKELSPQANASFTIVNALWGTNNVIANFKTTYDPVGMYIKYRTYAPNNHLTIPAKAHPLAIYNFPVVTAQDKPIYELGLNPVSGEASTLFLTGTLEHPETVMITKLPPYQAAADSLFGLRFINLSPDKIPVRISITGKGTDQTVSNLAYKASTDYLLIKANSAVNEVFIDFYNQISGVLLKRYTLKDVGSTVLEKNKWRYRNYTVVWLPNNANGTLAEDPFLVNDFE